jgi:hypothetical protein
MQFGFIILSHKAPEQVFRLCDTLGKLYGDPPIVCHHDLSQAPMDRSRFPGNVKFVKEWIRTGWGRWSVTEATLRAVRVLYDEDEGPDHFFLISGADYPTSRPETVSADLRRIGADAFIDCFSVVETMRGKVRKGETHLSHHRAGWNLPIVAKRYMHAQVRIPIVRFRPHKLTSTKESYPRLGAITQALPFPSLSSPFDNTYRCWAGSQWFSANRKVARKLLNPSSKDRHLQRYYLNRNMPDESYVHTVVCNDPDLTHHDGPFRWLKWHGAHPLWLGTDDFDDIVASKAHFSRKFKPNDPVLDRIDEFLAI